MTEKTTPAWNFCGWCRAIREAKLDPTVRLVLVMLGLRANDGGAAWPSASTIAADTGLGRTAVFRALARAEHAGLLERYRRGGGEPGSTPLYRLRFPVQVCGAEEGAQIIPLPVPGRGARRVPVREAHGEGYARRPRSTHSDQPKRDQKEPTTPRPSTSGGRGGGGGELDRIPCPPDLELLEAQAQNLTMGIGIPDWAIRALTVRFRSNFVADPNDRRTLLAWRKCLAMSIPSDWQNPKHRPTKPDDEPVRPILAPRIGSGPSKPTPPPPEIAAQLEALRTPAAGKAPQVDPDRARAPQGDVMRRRPESEPSGGKGAAGGV